MVTAYNIERYIAEAVESVLGQTYAPLEAVVVDDGSTDRTAEVCAGFASRIRYVRQANRGAAEARNTGLRHARGEFIAFLDGDDVWRPEHVATLVTAARRFPDSGLIATDGVEFSDGEGLLGTSLLTRVGTELLQRSESGLWHGHCYRELLAGTPVSTTSQVMVPARVFRAVGLWDGRFKVCQDYELYLRIAARFPFTLLGQRSVCWRHRSTGLSGPAELRYFNWRQDDVAILRRQFALADPQHHPTIRAQLRALTVEISRAAYYCGQRGARVWAARYLVRVAFKSRTPHMVAPYLIGVFLPAPMSRLASRIGLSRRLHPVGAPAGKRIADGHGAQQTRRRKTCPAE